MEMKDFIEKLWKEIETEYCLSNIDAVNEQHDAKENAENIRKTNLSDLRTKLPE